MDQMSNMSNADPGVAAPSNSMEAAQSAVIRDAGVIDPARAARVKSIVDKIKTAEKKYDTGAFKRARDDVKFAANLKGAQWDGDEDKYVANIVLRHVQTRTASLYAKNPRVRAKRKERMDFALWDEKPETLQAAMASVQAFMAQAATGLLPVDPVTGQPAGPDQQVMDLLADVAEGRQRREMVDKIGRTMTILYHHFLDEPQPRFKRMMKAAVKRAITAGLAWVCLSYQRAYEKNPETLARINDVTEQIARIESLTADYGDGEFEDDSEHLEELRQALASLQGQVDVLVADGLVHTFPALDRVILDPRTTQIGGFVGTEWLAEKFLLTPARIQEIWSVDVKTSFTAYRETDDGAKEAGTADVTRPNPAEKGESVAVVYKYYDKPSGTVSVVCEGYPDYLEEPAAPKVRMKRFFPYFPVMFNELEAPPGEIYPPSDARLLVHQQREYNRSREALRQHRIANQPGYITPSGVLDDEDKKAFMGRVPHAIHDIKGFGPGADAKTIIAAIPTVPIDPNLYETGPVFEDTQRTIGAQEANFGGTGGDTATEASISESGRISTEASAVDDLDETLSELARAGGEVLLLELDPETAKAIAGPGAVWPAMSRQDFADQVYLEVIAGSNGRPNKAQDAANLERLAPIAMQIPGIPPAWLARKVVEAMDSGVDLTEAYLDGLPSIMALNAMAKTAISAPPEGPPNGSDPNGAKPDGAPEAQGDRGGDNAAQPPGQAQGPQAAFPAPTSAIA